MDPNPKQQLIDRLKQANNILVTVSNNPSVDQLAACIGLTLVLNHMGKHGTAVFSGKVPSTIEFLKPDETLEKNTDSLRDFIIALDKSKADKLRYKVEDQVVRIFITPYRTSITDKDLVFSQGDFNVDVVVALGVQQQQELDQAITAHGRILHDATIASINTVANSSLGSINWNDTTASSLSELVVGLVSALDKTAFDAQMATALLTGIVAATDRFSNAKTTPNTMSASAQLMAAGANQQLVATELAPPAPIAIAPNSDIASDGDSNASEVAQPGEEVEPNDPNADRLPAVAPEPPKEPGLLEVSHDTEGDSEPEPEPEPEEPQVHIDETGNLINLDDPEEKTPDTPSEPQPSDSPIAPVSDMPQLPPPDEIPDVSPDSRPRITEPPQMSGELTANSSEEGLDDDTGELSLPPMNTPILSHNESVLRPMPEDFQPPSAGSGLPAPTFELAPQETLSQIEQGVDSPHLEQSDTTAPNVSDARDAVEQALNASSSSAPLPPIDALNAQPLGPPLNTGFSEPTPGNTPADRTLDMPLPPSSAASPSTFPGAPATNADQNVPPPPPVAPPMLPPIQ